MTRYLPQETLRRKRLGLELSETEIGEFVRGIADGSLSDAQVGAFAMAVCTRGMSAAETLALTLAMRDSGHCLDLRHLPGPIVDKHSTGGIGDVVSLMLGPMLAACGCYVPMISGRGLGHTGGTLDKLEAIDGYTSTVSVERLAAVVGAAGVAIVSASSDLAPADRRLYAIRDITATVESIPLITASILAKKLAERPQVLVLDVKCGSGATLTDPNLAQALAASLVDVARLGGVGATALLTDMSEALAPAVGNALELQVALAYLRGSSQPARLHAVTLALGAAALCDAGLARDTEDATRQLQRSLDSGAAAERFERMVGLQGGDVRLLEGDGWRLPAAPVVRPLLAGRAGYLRMRDARAVGMTVVALGGGRAVPEDRIDHRVGLSAVLPNGTWVEADTPMLVIHAADESAWARAASELRAQMCIDDQPPALAALIVAAASGQVQGRA